MQSDGSKIELASMRKILKGHAYRLAQELEPMLGFWPLSLISEILSGKRPATRGKSKIVADALRKRAAELRALGTPGQGKKRG